MKKEKSQCLKQQLCVQAGEQRCHAGCWESSLLLPDDSHSCSSAVTPFSFNHRPPWSCPLLLADCLDAEFSSCLRISRTCDLVQVLVYMVGEQSGRGLASTNFNTRLNAKQKKERVSSVGDLVKKGGPTTS